MTRPNKGAQMMADHATFQGFLVAAQEQGVIDFHLRIVNRPDGGTDFYLHPDGKDGETGDFEVSGNTVMPKPNNLCAGSN